MPRRVGFSDRHLSLEEIAQHHKDLEQALRLYFREGHDLFAQRFFGYAASELAAELSERLYEIEVASAFSVMAALEAAFRIDYLLRNYEKRKDPVSRDLRALHKRKGTNASLEDDIFRVWSAHISPPSIIGDLRGAFNFRHWLAHGRYWQPKLGRAYDFATIYALAEAVLNGFPLERPA
jgi:hypothetical protein